MPGKLLSNRILKSAAMVTYSMVKSGWVFTNSHCPHLKAVVITFSTFRSSKLVTTSTLKSAKLFTTCTLPYKGISLHMQSAVMGLSAWKRQAEAMIKKMLMSFMASKLIKL